MLVLDMNTKYTAHSLVTANSVATPIVHLCFSLCPAELQASISARAKPNSSVSHATVINNAHAVACKLPKLTHRSLQFFFSNSKF